MKKNFIPSCRAKALLRLAVLLIFAACSAALLGYHFTIGGAMRAAERAHLMQPTETILEHAVPPATKEIGAMHRWRLSQNDDSILFGLYRYSPPEGWQCLFSAALDQQSESPYCADLMTCYSAVSGFQCYLFGAVTDPAVAELCITTDSRYADVSDPDAYTLSPRDMVYQNGVYYFALSISPTENPYISKVSLTGRSGTRQDYTFEKPKDLPPEFAAALQDSQ